MGRGITGLVGSDTMMDPWGHSGSDGTFALVSPEEELIVLVFGQSRGLGINAMRERFVKLVRAAILD